MQPWKRIEPTVTTKIGFRTITVKNFEMPDGHVEDWTVMHEDGWAATSAIALTSDNKIVVARQFRPGPEKVFNELPGGFVGRGEEPTESMLREFQEETGYRPGKVERLGTVYRDGYINGVWHCFLLTDCTPITGRPDEDPHAPIELILMDIDDFLQSAKRGEVLDAGAVLMAYDRLQEIKARKN